MAIDRKIRELITESSELKVEIKKMDKKIIRTKKLLQQIKTKKSVKTARQTIKNKRIHYVRRMHYLHVQSMRQLLEIESRIHVYNVQRLDGNLQPTVPVQDLELQPLQEPQPLQETNQPIIAQPLQVVSEPAQEGGI